MDIPELTGSYLEQRGSPFQIPEADQGIQGMRGDLRAANEKKSDGNSGVDILPFELLKAHHNYKVSYHTASNQISLIYDSLIQLPVWK